MDERVDRSDTKIAPDPALRVTPVTQRSRRGYWILIALILAGLLGGSWYLWTHHATPQTTTAGRNQPDAPGRAAAAGRLRHHRQGRHPHHPERARHRHLARHGDGADADQRPVAGDRVQGRPGGQEGRLPGADRSAALSGGAGAGAGHARPRPGPAGPGADQPEALPDPRPAGLRSPSSRSTTSATWCSSTPAPCRPTRARSTTRS